jgi:hypothetical protein
MHYDEAAAIRCMAQTNSTVLVRKPDAISAVFMSPDGLSAIEPVFVMFGSDRPTSRGTTALGIADRRPVWTIDRGDARVEGYGPYVPPIAKKQGVAPAAARAAADELGRETRAAVEGCLDQNQR